MSASRLTPVDAFMALGVRWQVMDNPDWWPPRNRKRNCTNQLTYGEVMARECYCSICKYDGERGGHFTTSPADGIRSEDGDHPSLMVGDMEDWS